MLRVRLDLGNVPQLLSRIQKMEGLKRGVAAAATHLKSKVAVYPPVSRRKAHFKNAEHRRKFFGLLRRGLIDVPYIRGASGKSEKLGQSWTVELRNGGLTGIVGTRASYAPLVQGTKQAMYHKVTGWKTAEAVGVAEGRRVSQIVGAEIEGMLEG